MVPAAIVLQTIALTIKYVLILTGLLLAVPMGRPLPLRLAVIAVVQS